MLSVFDEPWPMHCRVVCRVHHTRLSNPSGSIRCFESGCNIEDWIDVYDPKDLFRRLITAFGMNCPLCKKNYAKGTWPENKSNKQFNGFFDLFPDDLMLCSQFKFLVECYGSSESLCDKCLDIFYEENRRKRNHPMDGLWVYGCLDPSLKQKLETQPVAMLNFFLRREIEQITGKKFQ